MKMNKSIVALAVSGGIAAMPMAASAEPEVYGLFDVGIESYSADTGAPFDIFFGLNGAERTRGDTADGRFTNSDDRAASLNNGMQSRIGLRGSEDLGNGLSADYQMEFGAAVLSDSGGSEGSAGLHTRLGWAGLSGDWGSLRIGTQWQPMFAYSAWNVHRSDTHGYGSYFSAMRPGRSFDHSMAYGYREAGTIQYQYGSGGYGTDPFTFTVSLGTDQNDSSSDSTGEENENFLTSMQVFGATTFLDGALTLNGGVTQYMNKYDTAEEIEPSTTSFGGRFRGVDNLEIGFNWINTDTDGDTSDDSYDTINVMGAYDFGGGFSGHLGYGTQNADDGIVEISSNIYGFVRQALSDRTNVRLEVESISYDENDSGGFDDSQSVVMAGFQHSF